MKKLLAMVLALVMTLSLAVSASAVKADEKINEDYAEAVAVLNGMGVFKGYEDGSFKPENNITRAEVATIIYRIYTGDVAKNDKSGLYASYNKFTDMAGAGWAAGYIGYCSNAELVKGYPNGTFQPSGNITGYEVLAMILRAVGYDKNGEFTGADWALNVAKYAEQLHILDNVAKTTNLGAPATRELVSEILFRAINVPMVTYTTAFGYQNVGLNGDKDGKLFQNNVTLGKKNFDLKKDDKTADKFGRPTITWTYKTGDEETVIAVKPLATFTEPAKNCEVYDESGLAKATKLDVYTNSEKKDGTYVIADNKEDSKQAMQGRLTEVYKDRLVNVDTYLAEITKTVAEKTDAKGHVTKAYVLVDKDVYGYEGKTLDNKFVTKDEYKVDDLVLITVADGEIQSMVKAESKGGMLTKIKGNTKTINSIQGVMGIDKEDVKVTNTAMYTNGYDLLTLGSSYNFYFDTYGNVIGLDALASNYAVLDSLYIDRVEGKRGVDGLFGTPYFFNGEKAEGVAIDEVMGYDVKDNAINSNSSKNDDFYYTVYAYTVDKDGVYTFENAEFDTSHYARFVAGNKYITIDEGRLQLNKDTQILLQTSESPDGKIAHYTGYDKLPSFSRAWKVQYLDVNNDGYVDLFYACVEEFTTRTVFVYDVTPISSEIDADGNKIATIEVLELVDGELKKADKPLKVYYDYWDADEAEVIDIDEIGLYEVTEGENGVWYGIQKFASYYVDTYTTDGKRITAYNAKTGSFVNFDLDNTTAIAKYEGTWTKGTVDTEEWTAKNLNSNSYIFVQYDDTKVGNTFDALAVYDLYIKAPVTVDGEETKDVEYYGKDFNTITVTFEHEYEKIATAKMDDEDLTVKYFDKDGKEVTLAPAGTKVAYAEVSYGAVVTDPIVITTTKQAAASWKYLNDGEKTFASKIQSANIVSAEDSGTITVVVPTGTDVTVDNLKTLLDTAKKCEFQSIEIYNTDMKTLATGNLASDMVVKVTSWDKTDSSTYNITVSAT